MGRGRSWQEHELEYLRENWQLPDAELSAHLGRAVGVIQTKRRALGLIGKSNRRKGDWSQEELDYLAEVWGEKTIPEIAKRLGRSINAVKVKSVRLGYTSQKWYGSMMSARKVSELLGVDVHAVTDYWIPKCGLKGRRRKLGEKGSCTIVKFDHLLKWLEANTDKWDSRRVEEYALGQEPPWLIEKRKADRLLPTRRAQKWTPEEDARLAMLYRKGNMTNAEIGLELGRSASAVEHRALRLDIWGTGKYIGDRAQEERRTRREAAARRELVHALCGLLLLLRNELGYEPYWQRHMCMKWHDVKGCTAGCTDCDSCVEFERIRPQYCHRCGAAVYQRERVKWILCDRCRKTRKSQHQRKWRATNGDTLLQEVQL